MNPHAPIAGSTPLDLRRLTRPALVGALGTAMVAAALLFAPISPLAFGRADSALGWGDAETAARAFKAIGTATDIPEIQHAALGRAAQVYALKLDDTAQARKIITYRLALETGPSQEAALREQLAELSLRDRDIETAARHFHRAWVADPSQPNLLARAAELSSSIGHAKKARVMYEQLRDAEGVTDRSWVDRANLGLGTVSLYTGKPSRALRPFQLATRSSAPEIARAARLGLATCYEQLGELEGALAELDQSDLPDPLRERRKAALRERALVQN